MSEKTAGTIKGKTGFAPRDPDYVVRAKTGNGNRDWSTVGVAWNCNNNEGVSIKLNSIPIGGNWDGVLKVLPALAPYDDDTQGDMLQDQN